MDQGSLLYNMRLCRGWHYFKNTITYRCQLQTGKWIFYGAGVSTLYNKAIIRLIFFQNKFTVHIGVKESTSTQRYHRVEINIV